MRPSIQSMRITDPIEPPLTIPKEGKSVIYVSGTICHLVSGRSLSFSQWLRCCCFDFFGSFRYIRYNRLQQRNVASLWPVHWFPAPHRWLHHQLCGLNVLRDCKGAHSLAFVPVFQRYKYFSSSVPCFQIPNSLRDFTQAVTLVDDGGKSLEGLIASTFSGRRSWASCAPACGFFHVPPK